MFKEAGAPLIRIPEENGVLGELHPGVLRGGARPARDRPGHRRADDAAAQGARAARAAQGEGALA